MEGGKKRLYVISVSSLILVAMVVAVTIGVSQNTGGQTNHKQEVTTSVKAIKNICEPTDYKQVCVDSLTKSAGNTTDPKELVKAAFEVAIQKILQAAKNSTTLQQLQKDPRTKQALGNCRELAESAAHDLKRSFDQMGEIDASKFDDLLANLKTWLSGAITYQETCLEGFQNTTGDAGKKMREYLKTAMELTSNGLAMVTEISKALSSLNIQGFSRRLLSKELPVLGHDEFPYWVNAGTRKLLAANLQNLKPDLIVAKDGTGKYKTINEALKDIPKGGGNKTFVLYIKEGVYEEKVQFNRTMTHLMVVGDGPTKTRITGRLNFIDGTTTFHTATVVVLGDFFIAKDIGFENSAGPEKHQAVALRVGADMSIFYNCQMDGYQDTLYAHTYRQFYRNCVISGTIDFVFGDSASVFQSCTFLVRKPLDNQACIVTAQGRKDRRQPTAIVLQNCTIAADPLYYPVRNVLKSYLGRPWKEFSRTVIMESFIDDLIQPEGWLPWNGTFAIDTCFYTEYNNRGPGASKLKRLQWKGVKEVTKARVEHFTAGQFLTGDTWIPATGVPYTAGLIFPPPPDNPKAETAEEESEKQKERKKSDYEPLTKERAPDPGAGLDLGAVLALPPQPKVATPVPSPASIPAPPTSAGALPPKAASTPAPTPAVSQTVVAASSQTSTSKSASGY